VPDHFSVPFAPVSGRVIAECDRTVCRGISRSAQVNRCASFLFPFAAMLMVYKYSPPATSATTYFDLATSLIETPAGDKTQEVRSRATDASVRGDEARMPAARRARPMSLCRRYLCPSQRSGLCGPLPIIEPSTASNRIGTSCTLNELATDPGDRLPCLAQPRINDGVDPAVGPVRDRSSLAVPARRGPYPWRQSKLSART
jgi:hypothetical protein